MIKSFGMVHFEPEISGHFFSRVDAQSHWACLILAPTRLARYPKCKVNCEPSQSFASKETQKIFQGFVSKKLPRDIQRTARRKLLYLHDAEDIQDLRSPPGNRLEKLSGVRKEQYSIRINRRNRSPLPPPGPQSWGSQPSPQSWGGKGA